MSKSKNRGKIYPNDSLLMSLAVCELGTEENPEQFAFHLAGMKSPMIISKKTGKRFILPLEDLVAMAIEAGIELEATRNGD